jgi:hypothetical protein
LESQHYIGRQFSLTIENCELIFEKANLFSQKHFEVKFLFEIKLCKIIEASIKEQQQIIYDSSTQRFKADDLGAILDTFFNNEQNKQIQIQKFFRDLELRGICKQPIKNIGDEDSGLDANGHVISDSNCVFEGTCLRYEKKFISSFGSDNFRKEAFERHPQTLIDKKYGKFSQSVFKDFILKILIYTVHLGP